MRKTSPAIQAEMQRSPHPRRVLVIGATGTIGRAAVRSLVQRGHQVVSFIRENAGASGASTLDEYARMLGGSEVRIGNVDDPASLERDCFRGERFDVLVSCLASRTGAPKNAWAIDHRAQIYVLNAARYAGVSHFVLLSAICLQKPILAFQHAKLAFEKALVESGLAYTIVRPTAFFKSLSGQVERVRKGKPYLLFGDGTLTACKPISDRDVAEYLADCLDNETLRNRVLPIGGPGGALTPREQGECLFALFGRPPRFRKVPIALLDAVIRVLDLLGRISPMFAEKAEFARIGRYYATESMLVINSQTGKYDAAATPSTGTETLFDYYAELVSGVASAERGDHAAF